LQGAVTWRNQCHDHATLQGAATWWIQRHDFGATCHIAGCSHLVNSLSRFRSYLSHCRVLLLSEFNDRATLQSVRIPSAILNIVFRHTLSFLGFNERRLSYGRVNRDTNFLLRARVFLTVACLKAILHLIISRLNNNQLCSQRCRPTAFVAVGNWRRAE